MSFNENYLKFNILGKIYHVKENLIRNLDEFTQFYDENRHEYILDISPLVFSNILEYYSTKKLQQPTNIDINYYKDILTKFHIDTTNLNIRQYHERIVPKETIRQIIHIVFEYPDSCRLARILHYMCSMIALLNCLIVSLSFTSYDDSKKLLFILDCICLCWIIIETCLRLISVVSLYNYLSQLGLFDIIGVSCHFMYLILFRINSCQENCWIFNRQLMFLSVLRKVRLIRYIRPLKYFYLSLVKSKHELRRLFVFISFLLAFLAPLILIIESSSIYEQSLTKDLPIVRGIRTMSDACYFLILLITTVGYGEIYPISILANFIAMLASLSSLIIFSLILSSIYRKYISIRENNELQRLIISNNIRYLIYENKNQQQTRDITEQIKNRLNRI